MADPTRFISTRRRVREDRRFVTGTGRFVADIRLPGALHAAVVTSPHPAARIVSIDTRAALASEGVVEVLTGGGLPDQVDPIPNALETPGICCYPLAVDAVRYVGEWVAVVVARTRALAEDAAELLEVHYRELPFVVDAETALDPSSPPVHPAHGSNLLYRRLFSWGPVEDDFNAAPHHLDFELSWGRSATVPIETFGVVARWDAGRDLLDIWASIQMPSFAEQVASCLRLDLNQVRVHYDVDVGGSYGVKRGLKHTVVASLLARRTGRPVRLVEDRLENMAGGDMHGPERRFSGSRSPFDDDGHGPVAEAAGARGCRGAVRQGAAAARQAGERHRRRLPDRQRRLRGDLRLHQQDRTDGGARLRDGADQPCARDRPRPGRPAPGQCPASLFAGPT